MNENIVKTEKEKMLSGQMYHAIDPELTQLQNKAKMLTFEYNQTNPMEGEKRGKLLKEFYETI